MRQLIPFSFLLISIFSATPLAAQSKAEKTFDAFWTFFDENYAFFQEKDVDWQATYQTYRPLVSPTTTDDSLFTILSAMVRPFEDGHISIETSDGKLFEGGRPSRIRREFKGFKKADYYAMIDSTLLAAGFTPMKQAGPKHKGQSLFDYAYNNQWGYLRINRSTATGWYTTGRLLSLDRILEEMADKESLIIDIRFNPGGTDNFSLKVAGRFTEDKYLGHYKQEKDGKAHRAFTPLKAVYVKPRGKTKFLKPVVLLTNDVTVSAADVFALIMKELPQVTLLGENSHGSFSDRYPYIFPKRLPNGWKVFLSNQRYLSASKVNYEGIGVPVDIEVQNLRQDIESMHDAVLSKAFEACANPVAKE